MIDTKRYIKTIVVAALLFMMMVGAGCSTQRKAQPTIVGQCNVAPVTDVKKAVSTLAGSYADWTRVQIPLTLQLLQPKQATIGGTVTMVRNQSIFMSLRVLGMEVVTLSIDNQRVLFCDKWNKRYVEASVEDLLAGCPATVANLQDLLLGRAFVMGQEQLTLDAAMPIQGDVAADGMAWGFAPKSPITGLEYVFLLDAQMVMRQVYVQIAGKSPAVITYSDVMDTPIGVLPSVLTIDAMAGQTAVGALLRWDVAKIKVGDAVTVRSQGNLNGYTQLEINDLIKSLPGM